MRMLLVSVSCAHCGAEFRALDISPYLYGDFLMRSVGHDEVVFLGRWMIGPMMRWKT